MSPLDPASPRPLYQQLADHLRRQIEDGTWQPGDRLPPELEIATDLALSRGTVRQAMDLLVTQGLLQRTPGKGTFVTPPAVRPRSQLIGIVVPFMRDSLTTDILRGVEVVLRRSGYSLIFCHSEGDLQLEESQIARLLREGVSGLILFPLGTAPESVMLARLVPERLPVVLIDRHVPGVTADYVLVDNVGGAYRAVEHLLALGHRRIACVSLPERPSSVIDRIHGYQQALRAAGILPLAPIDLALAEHSPDISVPAYTADELAPIDLALAVDDPPTALFCINDFIALGVMQHVRDRLRIPEDLSIVGFDDIAIAPYMPVPLTTVAQPKYEIGVRAAQALIDQIARAVQPGREIVLPTSLVVRTSTGAPAPVEIAAPALVQAAT